MFQVIYVLYEIKFEKKNKNKIWDKCIGKLFLNCIYLFHILVILNT